MGLNFRIVENYSHDIDYESFKKDFLNPSMTVKDLREKYGIGEAKYYELRERVLDETGLCKKPTLGVKKNHKFLNAEYIQKKPNGWIISKQTNYRTKYFGRYKDIETARMVRDKLVESDWDEKLGDELKFKYGVERIRPAEIEAKKKYPMFKNLYCESKMPIKEIQKILVLTQRVYRYLLDMIYKEFGTTSRRALNRNLYPSFRGR